MATRNHAAGLTMLVALLATSVESSASDSISTSFDASLVDADAIVLATVESVAQTDTEVVSITLRPLRAIENRWRAPSVLTQLRVRGDVYQDGAGPGVEFNGDRPAIQQGRTYLFLLRGGVSHDGPFVNDPAAIMAVSEKSDAIDCGAGSVYGVTRQGVVCGRPETHYGPPLKVTEVCDELEKQLSRAKRTRFNRLQRRIRELEPMLLEPKNKVAP